MDNFKLTCTDEDVPTYYEKLLIAEVRAYELMITSVILHERLGRGGYGVVHQMEEVVDIARNENELVFLLYKVAELHGFAKGGNPTHLAQAVTKLLTRAIELGLEVPTDFQLPIG